MPTRLWINEQPPFPPLPLRRPATVQFEASAAGNRRTIVIEALLINSPASQYAGLGFSFVPRENGVLSVSYPSKNTGVIASFPDSLAGRFDRVHVGTADNYLRDVLLALEASPTADRPVGSLTVSHMLCGELGSSPFMFQRLTRTLLTTLRMTEADLTEARVVQVLRST